MLSFAVEKSCCSGPPPPANSMQVSTVYKISKMFILSCNRDKLLFLLLLLSLNLWCNKREWEINIKQDCSERIRDKDLIRFPNDSVLITVQDRVLKIIKIDRIKFGYSRAFHFPWPSDAFREGNYMNAYLGTRYLHKCIPRYLHEYLPRYYCYLHDKEVFW